MMRVVLFSVLAVALWVGGMLLLSWLDWREFWEEEEERGRRTDPAPQKGGEK